MRTQFYVVSIFHYFAWLEILEFKVGGGLLTNQYKFDLYTIRGG